MIEIEIAGLNPRQQVLADIIWSCDTKAEVDVFIKGLPTRALRTEAKSIVELMIMATVEQAYDGLADTEPARKMLRKYNKS